ncbi:hypothetical protein BGX34_009280 [Mortierella sp. NVP85]|nr:hypothetical protein BGX34_009280 [Mortierella sp. NVP85]
MSIASSDVIETMTNIHADVRNKAFVRKPRNMVLCSPIAGSDMEDVMITGSLDGSIDLWDLENRRVMSTISRSELDQPWSEDMCWVGKNVLAVASAHKEGVPLNHQLTLVHVEKRWTTRAALGQPGYTVSCKLQTLAPMPHDVKGIMCIGSMTEGTDGISMATAGMDKQIVHWRFASNSNGFCSPIQQQRIHSKHTSSVQTLCYAPQKNVLFSGGSDCKVVGWDMVRSEVVLEYKEKDGRINSIQQNPVDPNLFLICQALTCNQISLHDNRQRFERAVLCFGSDGADRLSKQILPSWHPNGALVSCGMQTESKINIWDIRWKDVRRGPGQSIDVHDKRVFKAAFHPRQSFITSMSAAGSLAFIDFRLNPGTVVHGSKA